ncbi:tetratricopeptide repeat protein [Roseomonas elaeocarpi]|uniref:Tetratricopeptide repeat protein n=1 Tax=Roseomonas elaeocarpi TaxID=907779 RepID=A0ABV6JX31_9PROT
MPPPPAAPHSLLMRQHVAAALLAAMLAPASLPALAQAPRANPPAEAARQAEAKRLLDALARAPDEESAAPVEARLRALWAQRSTPAARLLLNSAARNIRSGAVDAALEDLDAALTLQPDDPQGWILRAEAQSAAGAANDAARDLQQALRLDPTRFDALVALAEVQEGAGDLPGSLRSFEAAMKLNPHLAGGTARLRELRRRALGDNT